MNSSILPGFSATQALNTGRNGAETLADNSSKSSQSVDSIDDSVGFGWELRSALDALSGSQDTSLALPLTTAGPLPGGTDLPADGNGLPVPVVAPLTETSGPASANFGFIWQIDPASDAGTVTAGAMTATPGTAPEILSEVSGIQQAMPSNPVGANPAPAPVGARAQLDDASVALAARVPGAASHGAEPTARAPSAAPGLAPGAATETDLSTAVMGAARTGTAAIPARFAIDGANSEVSATPVAKAMAAASIEAPAAVPPQTGATPLSAVQPGVAAGVAAGGALAMGGPDWSNALAQRIGWMLEGQLGRAEIALDPPELGPLQVRITTLNDQTQVQFLSQHAAVRDALDQTLPRLREMLEAQGLQLAQADVSDQQQGDTRRNSTAVLGGHNTDSGDADSGSVVEEPALHPVSVRLIDAYA